MKIKFENYELDISTEILSIENKSSHGNDLYHQYTEWKNIELNLKISSKKRIWNIPYLVRLKKELKNEYELEYRDNYYKSREDLKSLVKIILNFPPLESEKYNYTLEKFLNQPFFEIFKSDFDETLFKLLIFLDSFKNSTILSKDYEKINLLTFFNFTKEDLENFQSENEFVIREYNAHEIVLDKIRLNEFYPLLWQIPHLDFKKIESVMIKSYYKNNQKLAGSFIGSVYLTLPKGYSCSYRSGFVTPNEDNSNFTPCFNDNRGANIFYGSFQECTSIMTNPKSLSKLRMDIYEEREKESKKSNPYDNIRQLEEDTAEALSDGGGQD